jgi:hypothetical protein
MIPQMSMGPSFLKYHARSIFLQSQPCLVPRAHTRTPTTLRYSSAKSFEGWYFETVFWCLESNNSSNSWLYISYLWIQRLVRALPKKVWDKGKNWAEDRSLMIELVQFIVEGRIWPQVIVNSRKRQFCLSGNTFTTKELHLIQRHEETIRSTIEALLLPSE